MYEIEFETKEAEYEYEIDAYTGKVLKSESESKDMKKSASKSKGAKEASGTEITPIPKSSDSYIDEAKAKEIVLQHSGLDVGQIRDLKIEFDNDDGKAIYEIEFKAGSYEYDYELDAVTGRIIKSEKDRDD